MNIVKEIERNELAKGFVPLHPGMAPWFAADDWMPGDCCSTDGHTVRIVTLIARQPRTGAFKRLIARIQDRGMVPVVVEPVSEMQAILKRWGWEPRIVGTGIDREFQYWPQQRKETR